MEKNHERRRRGTSPKTYRGSDYEEDSKIAISHRVPLTNSSGQPIPPTQLACCSEGPNIIAAETSRSASVRPEESAPLLSSGALFSQQMDVSSAQIQAPEVRPEVSPACERWGKMEENHERRRRGTSPKTLSRIAGPDPRSSASIRGKALLSRCLRKVFVSRCPDHARSPDLSFSPRLRGRFFSSDENEQSI